MLLYAYKELIMETAKRIKQRREELGISAEELARRIGKAKTTIYRYELGYIEKMPTDVLKAISEVLRTTPAYLMGWSDDPNGNSEPSNVYPVDSIVPLDELGTVRAGYGGCIDEIPTGKKVDIPVSMLKGRPSTDYFTLRVRGNSMYPKLIDGDTILCLRCDSVDSGSLAVILYNSDDATVKKVNYVTGEDWLELVPANPEYETKRLSGYELEQCRIIGKVVNLIREI